MAKTPFGISVLKRGIRYISKSLGNEGALHSLKHSKRSEMKQRAESEISIALIALGGKWEKEKRKVLESLRNDVRDGRIEPNDAVALTKIVSTHQNTYPHFLDWSRISLGQVKTPEQAQNILDLTRSNGVSNRALIR